MTSRAPLLTLMVKAGRSFLKNASGSENFTITLNRKSVKPESKLVSFLIIARDSMR